MSFLDVSILWYSVKIMKGKFILLLCGLVFLSGCRGPDVPEKKQEPAAEQKTVQLQLKGCRSCHAAIKHDENHNFNCTECHRGNTESTDREKAHADLIAKPAHPDSMVETCGRCHPEKTAGISESLHFTLRKKVNLIRKHFGAAESLNNLTEVPIINDQPSTVRELVDDMLRRRCLRCHVYSTGDEYPYTQRAAGCGACHLAVINGKLVSHEIIGTPGDQQCMSCHYGNFVGADYYGRFQNDFNLEYRTPYTTSGPYFRPYGVEYHDLAPDIHQQRGLACVDCHGGHQLMFGATEIKITCTRCHQWEPGQTESLPENVAVKDSKLILTARLTGKKHVVPQAAHPDHKLYGKQVDCQVCHAQWTFTDATTHLLRSDTDNFDSWERVPVQSSSEIEALLEHNLFSEEDELAPVMHDTITGREMPGIWLKGYTERRWERITTRRDKDGIIKIFRPILDLRVSYIDEDENAVFDNVTGSGPALLPYTPHTTGPAGLFYRNRFRDLLEDKTTGSSAE